MLSMRFQANTNVLIANMLLSNHGPPQYGRFVVPIGSRQS
jgi:hypothetical protein